MPRSARVEDMRHSASRAGATGRRTGAVEGFPDGLAWPASCPRARDAVGDGELGWVIEVKPLAGRFFQGLVDEPASAPRGNGGRRLSS